MQEFPEHTAIFDDVNDPVVKEMDDVVTESKGLIPDEELVQMLWQPAWNLLSMLHTTKREQLQKYRLKHNNYRISMSKIDIFAPYSALLGDEKKEGLRIEKILSSAGVFCISDICKLTEKEFCKIPNIGIKATCRTSDLLKLHGLSFEMTDNDLWLYSLDLPGQEVRAAAKGYIDMAIKKLIFNMNIKLDVNHDAVCKHLLQFDKEIRSCKRIADNLEDDLRENFNRVSKSTTDVLNSILEDKEKDLKKLLAEEIKRHQRIFDYENTRFRNRLIESLVDADSSLLRSQEKKYIIAAEKADKLLKEFTINK